MGGERVKIFILDTETTGLKGAPYDVVVDLGVVRLDTQSGDIMPVYDQVIQYDTDAWEPDKKSAWIFSHSDLCVDDVQHALMNPVEMAGDLNMLGEITAFPWTSYNVDFDFGKFLNLPPWNFAPRMGEDIMRMAARHVPGDHVFEDGTTSFPKLEKAYKVLCPDDPAHIRKQRHRALDDAIQAAYVMLAVMRLEDEDQEDEWTL